MSYLRRIMQDLQNRSAATGPLPLTPAAVLADHLAAYDLQLARCSAAMLQYEWAWLEQHIEALQLCLSQPDMLRVAGGEGRLASLLEESRRFRQLVEHRLAAAGIPPALHRGSVLDTAHAWEVVDPSIRRQWGFDGESGAPVLAGP